MEDRLEDITLSKLENTDILIDNCQYRLLRLFAERVVGELNERHGVFIAERATDAMECIVKMRIQRDPRNALELVCRDFTIKWAKSIFEDELKTVRIVESISSTPNLLGWARLEQTRVHEFAGGYLNVIAVTKMPGKPITDYDQFTDDEAQFIKREVTRILEEMRLAGWQMDEGVPHKVIFDADNRTVAITGIANGLESDPSESEPYTETSSVVAQFGQNVWWE